MLIMSRNQKVVAVNPNRFAIVAQRIKAPLLALLHQGATPAKLSFAIALGFVLGLFPLFGTTTLLCIAVMAIFRLNQAAAQIGNGASALFFFVLLIPFVRLGEYLTGAAAFPLSMEQLRDVAQQGSIVFFKTFSAAILHGIVGWLVVAPAATVILGFALWPLLRRIHVSR